jgi:hypothetical protein
VNIGKEESNFRMFQGLLACKVSKVRSLKEWPPGTDYRKLINEEVILCMIPHEAHK